MDSTIATCMFIGDGLDSHFQPNQIYEVQITQGFLGRIRVVPVHGFNHRPMVDMQETYRSLHAFFHNWQIREIIHGNFWNGAPMQQN